MRINRDIKKVQSPTKCDWRNTMGRRIMDSFLKNVACAIGIKYGLELILTECVAVSFINKNYTHPAE